MSSALLSDFPTELLIQVYKSLDNVKDITALNLVSHQFYDLWSSHALSISDAVFSRTIKSYHHARELVKLQQQVLERNHCDDDGHHDPYQRALQRNKLMISNIHSFHAIYEAEKQVDSDEFRFNREEIYFKTYSGLCMLILAEEDRFVSSRLASLNFETLRIIYSAAYRYREDYSQDGLAEILNHVHMRFGVGRIGRNLPDDTLKRLWKIVVELGRALERAEDVGNGAGNN